MGGPLLSVRAEMVSEIAAEDEGSRNPPMVTDLVIITFFSIFTFFFFFNPFILILFCWWPARCTAQLLHLVSLGAYYL